MKTKKLNQSRLKLWHSQLWFVLAFTTEAGEIVSPALSHPFIENIFVLIGTFEDYDAAFQHFNSFVPEDDYIYQMTAFPVQSNQIWLIKSGTDKFGIILVTSASYYERENKSHYAEVTFKAKIL